MHAAQGCLPVCAFAYFNATECCKDSKHYIKHHQILLITLTYAGIGAPVATTTPKDALYSKTKRLRNKQV